MNRNRVSAHINSMSAWRREHAAHAIRVQDFHPPHWTEQLAKPFPAGKTKEKGIKVLSSDGPSSGSNCLSRRGRQAAVHQRGPAFEFVVTVAMKKIGRA